MRSTSRLAFLLFALAAWSAPALAGDLRLTATGTIVAVPNTPPPPFSGVQPGDPVTLTFEVFEPANVPVPFLWNYDVDFAVGGLQVGGAFQSFHLGSPPPGCTIQNDAPFGGGDVFGFSADSATGNETVLASISDPTGAVFSSGDLRTMIGSLSIPAGASANIGYGQAGATVYFGASLDVFLIDDAVPSGGPFCMAVPNSTGTPGTLSSVGSASVSANNFTLVANQLPTNQFGFLINSLTQAFIPGPGGSQGNLCLGSPIGRHNQTIGNSGNAGLILVDVDLNALPRPTGGPAQVMVGDTWNFQLWYRDLNPGPASNFTQGLSVTFN